MSDTTHIPLTADLKSGSPQDRSLKWVIGLSCSGWAIIIVVLIWLFN